MKRRSEHLVEKRDGRTEFSRATKLARSVHQALCSVGVDESWRALEVTAAVLAGLRQRQAEAPDGAAPLPTEVIAQAVQQVLVAVGLPGAAVAYAATANERARRRSSLAGRVSLVEGPAPSSPSASRRRLERE
jgi:hypothetical protein